MAQNSGAAQLFWRQALPLFVMILGPAIERFQQNIRMRKLHQIILR